MPKPYAPSLEVAMYHYHYNSPIGGLYLLTDGHSVRKIELSPQESSSVSTNHGNRLSPLAPPFHTPLAQLLLTRLQSYFEGEITVFHDLPFTLTGTHFQRRVWQQLQSIPHGTCCTYGQLAQAIGQPHAARAVGNAVGANPLMIFLPCHRVLGCHWRLTGYRGGLAAKKGLLSLEKIDYRASTR